jgi:hypothetical protein
MKKLSLFLMLSVVMMLSGCSDDDKAEVTLNFESKLSAAESEMTYEGGNEYGEWGYMSTTFTDPQNLVTFSNYYHPSWGFGGGFTYTNKTDVTTSGYTNISAITGKGVNGNVYLTVALSNPATMKINNSGLYRFKELYITNSTYAYLSMKDGDYYASAFGADDWFKLTIYNADKSAKVDVLLAEGTNLLNEWKKVDLSALGNTDELQFEMSSTKNNDYGMVTPNYFCMDGITLIEK